jgi:hypothetical protein
MSFKQYLQEVSFNFPKGQQSGKPAYIEWYYDRQARSYCVTVKDTNGFQIGDAAYSGTKAGCKWDIDQFKKEFGLTQIRP